MKSGFKSEKNELAFSSSIADRWDLHVSWTHMSSRRNRAGGATLRTRPELADGKVAGGEVFTT